MSEIEVIRRKYRKDFLKKVIVRMDFDSTLPILPSGPPKSVYSHVKERFPITEEKKVIGKEFLISQNSTQERSTEIRVWDYFGKSREKHLAISSNFMFIEYDKYEYFELLRDDFLSVSNALFDAYPMLQVNKLGLRYIDNIEFSESNPTEWDNYLKSELNTIFNIVENREILSRAFHILEFNFGDDLLRFQYGMFNPDYPSPIKKKVYTLDFDMYTTRLLEKKDIGSIIEYYHEKLNRFFEDVITDELRNLMEPVDEK